MVTSSGVPPPQGELVRPVRWQRRGMDRRQPFGPEGAGSVARVARPGAWGQVARAFRRTWRGPMPLTGQRRRGHPV